MKTKTIFKTLALAMLMPTMLLTTACSSEDELINTEKPTNTKGYALPVTINVTRQGDTTTRATYDGETKKLSFSAGDKLFVSGFYDDDNLYDFAGVLTWQPGDTFSGTIYLEGPFEGTAEELLSSALGANATLLPAGYGGYGFLGIDNEGTCDASLNLDKTKTFALTKATAVEQFSEESAEEYNKYNNGFALSPERAIVCFTISGLEENKEVAVSFKCNHPWGADYSWSIDDNVTVDATGVATFAVGMAKYENFTNYSLTVGGNAITLPADKEVEAGKIYNISRSVAPAGPTAYSLAESTVGMIVGSDGKAYAVADKDNLPEGVTAVAMVAYKSANAGESLAIALSDESDENEGMNWSLAESTCERKDKIGGNSWKLPSEDEWNQMFGADVNADEAEYEVNYTDLKTAITNAGGTALLEYIDEDHQYAYWSSTTGVEEGYRLVLFYEGVAYWQDFLGYGMLVRAVLAF